MARIVLVAPGRGTYTRSELGYLARFSDHPRYHERRKLVEEADAMRRAKGEIPVSELDQAKDFRPGRHLPGENASALIFTCSAADAALIDPDHQVVAVLGNSMGWYSALYLSGVLSFAEAFRLVDGMGLIQRGNQLGGQLLYPLVGDDWRPRRGALREVLRQAAAVSGSVKPGNNRAPASSDSAADDPGPSRPVGTAVEEDLSRTAPQTVPLGSAWASLSIRLGGYAVLGGTEAGLKALESRLPAVTLREREFPFRLARHSAFHTQIMQPASRFAKEEFNDLRWRQPRIPAIDGRGAQWKPMQTLAGAVSHYTLVEQVLRPFDFTAAVRVAAREYNPDYFVLLGPGESLGGALAQVLIADGWRGLSCREAFQEAQQSRRPPLLSMTRTAQAGRIL